MRRREFLALGMAATPLLTRARREHEPLRVGFLYFRDVVTPESATRAGKDGIALGWSEARQMYGLLGRELVLTESHERAAAVITIADAPERRITAPLLVDARARVPAGPCGADVFRIGIEESAPDEVLLWHPRLERFGAAQLNERFERRFGRPMNEHAWAGWFAIKTVAEAGLRAESLSPGHLRDWLGSRRAHLDGHKGVPLRFDADRRLVQPVYRLVDGVPVEAAEGVEHAC